MGTKGISYVIALVATFATVGGTILYNNFVYDKDGYNKQGYTKSGFDREGYNKSGYDSEGYDRNGFNRSGFDREGYSKSGYDSEGYDKNGFDVDGYDRRGYNKDGLDRQGYYETGYNSEGIDRGGKSNFYYDEELKKMDDILKKANVQMKSREFAYALHDIRIGLEKGVKCVIIHWKGSSIIKERLDDNITLCKKYKLLPRELVEKMYDAKNHCNQLQHDTDLEKNYGQVYFAYKTLEELRGGVKALTYVD